MDLAALQYKLQHNLPLTAAEEAYQTKGADQFGQPSHRKWQGLKEWPNSDIDRYDPAPVVEGSVSY